MEGPGGEAPLAKHAVIWATKSQQVISDRTKEPTNPYRLKQTGEGKAPLSRKWAQTMWVESPTWKPAQLWPFQARAVLRDECSGRNHEKQNMYIVSKSSPTKHLLIRKEKQLNLTMEKAASHHWDHVTKVTIACNKNRHKRSAWSWARKGCAGHTWQTLNLVFQKNRRNVGPLLLWLHYG